MRVQICAVGRLRGGPEKALIDDYVTRFERTGRGLGLTALSVVEVEDKKGGGMEAEAALLERALPKGCVLVCLDERGRVESSPQFAERLAGWRDKGAQDVAFVIGRVAVRKSLEIPAAYEPMTRAVAGATTIRSAR